jgi:hypothetical protein
VERARSAAAMLGLAGFVVLAVLDYARTVSTSTPPRRPPRPRTHLTTTPSSRHLSEQQLDPAQQPTPRLNQTAGCGP